MSQTVGSPIYTGPWVNWSRGFVLGSTITLSERNGGLLTAFLAIFVAAAGSACWRIVSYTWHQKRASQGYQDGLHHQQQATFRNMGTPGGAAWDFIQLIWYWRKHAVKPVLRTIPMIAIALLHLSIFGLAGIFSSEVTKAAGNETLVRSANCGLLLSNTTASSSKQALDTSTNLDTNDTLAATTYARACYSNPRDSLSCNQYVQPALSWKTNQNASCPFSPELCFYGGTAAYEMDTGPLDSHEDLGMNAPKSHRVQYRKVTTCSPIHAAGHVTEINITNPDLLSNGDTVVYYKFGDAGGNNYTYEYNLHNLALNNGYAFTGFIALASYSNNTWDPIPALNRTDADVSIFFFSPNAVMYDKPVTDPFYAATNVTFLPNGDGTNITYYTPDRVVSSIACTDQFQFCNPTSKKCTQLTGQYVLGNNDDQPQQLNLNLPQNLTVSHIQSLLPGLTTWASVDARGASALQASETVHDDSFQIGLPNNQWMKEVSTWFGVSMAKLQQKFVQYATGPPYVPDGYNLVKPSGNAKRILCKNQKIRSSTGTTSFSVLGVAIILIVGSLLIVTNLLIDFVMQFLRKRLGWKEYKSLQWNLDWKWQLQRLAYEEAGQGHWTGGADAVPVTRKYDKIGIPENVDMTHPRLGQARAGPVSYIPSTPEGEALVNQKGLGYSVVRQLQ